MKPPRSGFRLALLAILTLVLGAGCRGDDNTDNSDIEESDPAVTVEVEPVAVDLASSEFATSEFICTEEDVPPAFEYVILDSGEISAEESSSGAPDPAERERQYEDWGRVDAQFAAFSSESLAEEPEGIAYFECGLERYRETTGARRAFTTLSSALEQRVRDGMEAGGYSNLEFLTIPSPQIGDATAAVSGTATKDGAVFEFFAVTFRRLNMIGYSLSAALEMFSFVEDAANIAALMARLVDEKVQEIEEAMEEGEDGE